jgi:hypothetical protein
VSEKKKSITYIKGSDGEIIASRTRGYFKNKADAQEHARGMLDNPGGTRWIKGTVNGRRAPLVVTDSYLRGVRDLDPSLRSNHIEFLAGKLRSSYEVIFRPDKKTATIGNR